MVDVPSLIGSGVVAALVTATGGAYAARQSSHASNRMVDAQAYTRAREIDSGIVDSLRNEISRLKVELADTRHELEVEERKNAALIRRIDRCEDSINRCLRLLRDAGIDVPKEIAHARE